MSRIYSSEQVSRGHVDKICDQIADAIVTDCLAHDKDSRVAVEVLIKNETVMARIGIDKLGYSSVDVRGLITKQSPDIAMGVDKGGAGDQGIMYGYATNETAEFLPMPFAVATTFIQRLEELNCPMLMPDAKAQVSYDYDTDRITTFLCSVQHDADADLKSVRKVIKRQICYRWLKG